MSDANLLILVAALLPPTALDLLGETVDVRTVETEYGTLGPVALRRPADGPAVWVQPYTGLPSRSDPRATVLAAHALGVNRIFNWDMGVALNPVLQRGQPLLVDDYVDFTRRQPDTFADSRHQEVDLDVVALRPSFCPEIHHALGTILPGLPSGVYLGVDGPRHETPAEARLYRQLGADVAGQNMVPEVALAQELGLCYGGLVTVARRSAEWEQRPGAGEVRAGLSMVAPLLPELVRLLVAPRRCPCGG